MLNDNKVWIAQNEAGENVYLLPKMANRHGLIAGATGTGKTITLKVLAESFSDMGVPVFLADVKGDLAGMVNPGVDSEDMQKRIAKFGLAEAGFNYHEYPVTFWDIYGEKGIQLRTTITEMGPILLARILGCNDLQSDLLNVAFKIADDEELLLVDTKDLKALLNYMSENAKQFRAMYGNISSASIGAIVRAIVALESEGGDKFFGEPALNILDFFTLGTNGRGMISILDSETLINNGKLYSTFLLWLMSELFETLPEVGDLEHPKMVFFFDEAHLLFKDASKTLIDKIEQVVKLIRSKGVGIYFVTQNPRDIPDGVLAQLGNKVQHGLHAYTPTDRKAVKAAADSFRENPAFSTMDAIQALGTGEAVVSMLDAKGIPTMVEKVKILPPQSQMGSIDDAKRNQCILGSIFYTKYANGYDPESAYEFLQRRGVEAEEAKLKEQQAALEAKAKAKEEAEAAKAKAKEEAAAAKAKEAEARKKKRAAKTVGSSVAGTVGREVGKQVGSTFGSFGKTLGGNVGASLGRGLLSTLFKD